MVTSFLLEKAEQHPIVLLTFLPLQEPILYFLIILYQNRFCRATGLHRKDKLSGIGLQFGYRWEKWRASFTHYTGTGADNELTNSLIADYFFQEKFFVGAGLASIKLTNSSSGSSLSASATSPVLQVGYTENITKNLKLSIGVLQYSSGLSLSSTTLTPTTPTSTFWKNRLSHRL